MRLSIINLLNLAKLIFVDIELSDITLSLVLYLYYPIMQIKWLIANSYTVIFIYKCRNLTCFGYLSFLESTLTIEGDFIEVISEKP